MRVDVYQLSTRSWPREAAILQGYDMENFRSSEVIGRFRSHKNIDPRTRAIRIRRHQYHRPFMSRLIDLQPLFTN